MPYQDGEGQTQYTPAEELEREVNAELFSFILNGLWMGGEDELRDLLYLDSSIATRIIDMVKETQHEGRK